MLLAQDRTPKALQSASSRSRPMPFAKSGKDSAPGTWDSGLEFFFFVFCFFFFLGGGGGFGFRALRVKG